MESPLRLTAHGGFGEGDGETRLSKGRKVRPVPTLRSGGGAGERPGDHSGADAHPCALNYRVMPAKASAIQGGLASGDGWA